ncbi:amidohydrolase family protein [Intrasporangium mesophilum]
MHVIRAAQVFDGERFIGAADVVLGDGVVVDVVPPREHASDVAVEDLGEVTVLPGLVDAHQHLSWDCSPDPAGWHRDNDDDALLDRARANARRALAAGVTTVRDLGGRGAVTLALRDELARQVSAGPALLAAGPALTTPGGHCWFLGGECADADALSLKVAELAGSGVDVVKVMATGGNVTAGSMPHESQFGLAELRVVVAAAHDAGVPVAAHAHGTSGVADAVGAGVDTIEHCSFMTAEGIGQDPALVDRLASSGIPVSLTGGSTPGGILPPAIAVRMPALMEHIRRLLDAGVTGILSTDAGIGPAKPHDILVHAIIQSGQLIGIPIEQALVMTTSRAADTLGLGDRAGRLRGGQPADVLVVAGRLDQDPEALLRPVRVLRGGVVAGSG